MSSKRTASKRPLHKHRARLAGHVISGVFGSAARYLGTVLGLLARGQLTELEQFVSRQRESLQEPAQLRGHVGQHLEDDGSVRAQHNNLWYAAYHGSLTDAFDCFAKADALEDAALRAQGLEPGQLRLIGSSITISIGHSAVGLAARARLSAFGENPTAHYLMLSGGAANLEYLRFWSRSFPIVETTAAQSRAIEQALWPMLDSFHTIRTREGSADVKVVDARTALQWELDGREPLLCLDEQDRARGYAALARWGVTPDDWFACLHIRQSPVDSPGHARNAEVQSYLPAITAITDAGGFVIRIGAPSTTPLPALERVIDLAHAKPYDPWLDVFSIAASRFMVATTSGPMHVAPTFGVPVLATNQTGIGGAVFMAKSLVLPKRLQLGTNPPLALPAMLASELGLSGSYIQDLPDAHGRTGYHWLDNSPEEIRAGVLEMLAGWTPQESAEQQSWRQALLAAGSPVPSRIAQSYLDLNPDVL